MISDDELSCTEQEKKKSVQVGAFTLALHVEDKQSNEDRTISVQKNAPKMRHFGLYIFTTQIQAGYSDSKDRKLYDLW